MTACSWATADNSLSHSSNTTAQTARSFIRSLLPDDKPPIEFSDEIESIEVGSEFPVSFNGIELLLLLLLLTEWDDPGNSVVGVNKVG